MRIHAFKALRPPPEIAQRVASVPYDTVDTAEAAKLAAGNSRSFLRVVRSEIDLPGGIDIHSDLVYARAAENLAEFMKNGTLVREDKPCVYIYRQRLGDHVQSGVVACCHVDEYRNNVIRKHEKTRPDKEDDRTRHIIALRAHTGPVFLTYRDDPGIDALAAEAEEGAPLYDFTAGDGTGHTVWRVPAPAVFEEAFGGVPVCYIADGHHRAASACRAAAELDGSDGEHRWFECVLFPASQLRILPYNRCVSDLNGMTADEFLTAVKTAFLVNGNAAPSPGRAGRISMYLDGKWHGLACRAGAERTGDPTRGLDVNLLQENLLGPILGITDPRTDRRIEFVGGIRGTGELTARVDSGRAAAAFSMFPVTVEQMMAIADAGMIMPPKSTWFEPKLRSGLLVHLM